MSRSSMKQRTLEVLKARQAIITNGHFSYLGGRHGSVYVNKDAIYPHARDMFSLAADLATLGREFHPDVTISPAVGAVILSQLVSYHLTMSAASKDREILAGYADKEGESYVLRRGYNELVAGKRVLIVEDFLTTGRPVSQVISAVRRAGGYVVGAIGLVDRGGSKAIRAKEDLVVETLLTLEFENWESMACPLCHDGVPLVTRLGED